MEVRLDRWLWAARFFKTRPLAQQAISGGKIRLNGAPVKPGHRVRPGDNLTIRRGALKQEIEIVGCSDRRGPATTAAKLYVESIESVAARQQQLSQQLHHPGQNRKGRPEKRERRALEQLHRFRSPAE